MHHDYLLPPASRLVHVGPPKTGTTAIQQAFKDVRTVLAEHGVHYAGPGSRPRDAVDALLSDGRRGKAESWADLVAEVAGAGSQRVCISNEQFAATTSAQTRTAIEGLGGPLAHVVLTVRPLAALLPSQWQQRVRRSFRMIGYDDWLREVLDGEPGSPHFDHFWHLHDLPALLQRWSLAGADDRITAIVSDETDRDFLPRVFEGLLGLPEGLLVPPADRSNRSLDHAESELLRQLDAIAAERGWPRKLYVGDLKPRVSKRLRALPRQSAFPILLPDWARDRVVELDGMRAETLKQGLARVIGDPSSLTANEPQIRPADRPAPAIPVETTAVVMDEVIDALLARQERQDNVGS